MREQRHSLLNLQCFVSFFFFYECDAWVIIESKTFLSSYRGSPDTALSIELRWSVNERQCPSFERSSPRRYVDFLEENCGPIRSRLVSTTSCTIGEGLRNGIFVISLNLSFVWASTNFLSHRFTSSFYEGACSWGNYYLSFSFSRRNMREIVEFRWVFNVWITLFYEINRVEKIVSGKSHSVLHHFNFQLKKGFLWAQTNFHPCRLNHFPFRVMVGGHESDKELLKPNILSRCLINVYVPDCWIFRKLFYP